MQGIVGNANKLKAGIASRPTVFEWTQIGKAPIVRMLYIINQKHASSP